MAIEYLDEQEPEQGSVSFEDDSSEGFDEYDYQGQTVKIPTGTEPTAELLDSLGQEQGKIQKQEAQDLKINDAADASELMFPFTSRAIRESKGGFGEFVAGAKDIFTAPLRATAAAGRSGILGNWGLPKDAQGQPMDMSYGEALGQINRGENPQGESSLIGDIYTDPAALPLMATGAGAAGWIFKGGKWLPRLGRAAAVGAGEGALSGAAHQVEDVVLEGQEFSPSEMVTETALSAAAPLALGASGGLVKLANKGLGKLSSQLSNVAEETLRKWGTGLGKGAKELKDIHGKQKEIGDKILNALDNFDEFTPEKDIIDNTLKGMPDIPMENTLKSISGAIEKFPMKKINAAPIQKLKDLLADTKSKGEVLSAEGFRKFRAEIDDIVEWGKTGSKKLNKSLMDVRTSMKNELLDVAEGSGNVEYKNIMKSWADKLQKRDALLEEIGASSKTRAKRVGAFLSTLHNKNKETRVKALNDLKEIFGEDFVKQAKLIQMSDEIISDGSGSFAKILPNFPTGKAGTALSPGAAQIYYGMQTGSPKMIASGVATAGAASPMVSSKMLSAAELAEWMANTQGIKTVGSQVGRRVARSKDEN